LSDEITTIHVPKPPDAEFDEILYWIYASTDDFDLPAFRHSFGSPLGKSDDAEVSVAPREGSRGSYHAFLSWLVTSDDVMLTLEYHNGPMERAPDEREPFAEDLIAWLGRFFSSKAVTVHAHVRIRYSTETHTSKMPLVLGATPPCDAELYGVALRLKARPDGASSVRLTRGQSHWYAEVIGERSLTFDRSTPLQDVAVFRDVLSMFLDRSDV
jgi:hypothetical protein